MAKSISDEELQLRKRARRRLVGAIALVTIVAVFLPMVLDHEPKPVRQDVSIQIPSPNSGTFTSKIVPVEPTGKPATEVRGASETVPGASAPSTPAAKAETPVAKAEAPARAEGAKAPPPNDTEAAPPKKVPPDKPTAAEGATSKSRPAADKTKARARSNAAFVVQVAALNDADKAKQIRDQLAAAGVKVYTEIVPTTKGNVTRVRAGPFASRDDAERARDRLKGMGLSGNVVPK